MMEPHHRIFCHNAGVLTLFKKEIPPLSNYRIQTRIWTWNEKWFWLQHRFLLPGDVLACTAVSKLVFKQTSGKTVKPEQVLAICGHELTPDVEERRARNWRVAEHLLQSDALLQDPDAWDEVLPVAKM